VVSSLDLFPTVSELANVPLPTDRVYDGRSIVDILLNDTAVSPHKVLFFYGGANGGHDMLVTYRHDDPSEPGRIVSYYGPSAARMGCWKAMWGTGSGMGTCSLGGGDHGSCPHVMYPLESPLLFNVCIDPSEGIPLFGEGNGSLAAVVNNTMCGLRPWCRPNDPHCGGPPCPPFNASNPGPSPLPVSDEEIADAVAKIVAAVKVEMSSFTYGTLVAPDLLPGEINGSVGICCDKDPFSPPPANFSCDCNGRPYSGSNGVYAYVDQC